MSVTADAVSDVSAWFSNMTTATEAIDAFTDYVDDIVTVRWYLLYIALIGFGICIISMFFIRIFAGVFVWIILLLFLASIYAIAGYSYKEY